MTRARDLAKGTFSGDLTVDTNTLVVDSANNKVGIGTSSPEALLHVDAATNKNFLVQGGTGDVTEVLNYSSSDGYRNLLFGGSVLRFETGAGGSSSTSERMRIDSSGNVLVGMTTASTDNNGVGLRADGLIHAKRADVVANFNRQTSSGTVVEIAKDNTVRGRIGIDGDSLWITSKTNMGIYLWDANALLTCSNAGGAYDNQKDLGAGAYRWRTIYAGTGSINTSDRTEKQDIDVMSEAETRVAVACKGLMRKFRFIDAVEAKGDDARIHFGIIAQDLQDAFAAEGLDASRYAMFCSDTWWEADRVVPAVEAVDATLDDEGNQITEAVVAVAEHTVTDKFMTLEEAPEGATERTRLGVRYSELLAFIIGAL